MNQYWEEREIARRESQSPGFQKKVQTLSSKVNKMELRSGIKDKCIRDELKEYFGLDKLRDLVMFQLYIFIYMYGCLPRCMYGYHMHAWYPCRSVLEHWIP